MWSTRKRIQKRDTVKKKTKGMLKKSNKAKKTHKQFKEQKTLLNKKNVFVIFLSFFLLLLVLSLFQKNKRTDNKSRKSL